MLYINGEWKNAQSGKTISVINPANGQEIDQVAYGDQKDTAEAIHAAEQAFGIWSRVTAKERGDYLRRAAQLLRERTDGLARQITLEMGKPLAESKGEVGLALDYLDWYAEEAKRIYGDIIPASSPDKRLMVFKQPIGVTAAVTPWNFPIAMITRKIAPAIAAGCPVVVKPATATPLSAIEVFKAFHETGLPEGVANLIIGPASSVVGEMLHSPAVRKLTFTGSTQVGKNLMRDASDTVKKVSMELGGHAPFLVFADADLEKAAEGAIASKFRNAGQTCICTNRIYVEEQVAEPFSRLVAEKMKAMRIGNGLDEGVTIGPLIDEEAVQKVEEHIQDAVSKGAEVLCGGKAYLSDETKGGHFYEPTVLLNANDTMKIASEETFGPVAPIFSFKTEEEAIQRANNTIYGLASYVFTKDLSRSIRVAEALEYGIVGVNDAIPTVAQAPFGGVKESGVGREGGKYGIEEYLEEKFVSIALE